MVSQKDIFLSAQVLIKKHGQSAETIAQQKMREMLDNDDVKGAGVWLAISSAIEDLLIVSHSGQLH
jgi:hypothetical protein